jgi:dTDP-4-amino-4,6-dideoxygalactose transaminase
MSQPPRHIRLFPTLSPGMLLPRMQKTGLPRPLCDSDTTLFFNARNALWALIGRLRLPSGSNVLLPSYNCGAEVDPFLKSGVNVRFYRVSRALQIDLESIEKAIDRNTRAILVTHYFGFGHKMEPLVEFCRRRELLLLEDCAHALYSNRDGRHLGTFGAASVFSMWKFLPIPNGGALVVNDETLRLRGGRPKAPPSRESVTGLTRLLGAHWLRRGDPLAQAVHAFVLNIKARADAARPLGRPKSPMSGSATADIYFHLERAEWGMAAFSKLLVARAKHFEIVARRQENFRFLLGELNSLKQAKPVFYRVGEGTCPSFFPLFVDDPVALRDYLLPRGIECSPFWKHFHDQFPKEHFPDAKFLKTHILALPVHQDLDRDELQYIVRALRAFRE